MRLSSAQGRPSSRSPSEVALRRSQAARPAESVLATTSGWQPSVSQPFFGRPLPGEAVAALLEAFVEGRAAGESRELDFMPWGGAYNRRRPEETAFVHRDERFPAQARRDGARRRPSRSRAAAHRAVTRSWASVHAWGSGRAFQNYADPDLEHWAPPTTAPTTPGWFASRRPRRVRPLPVPAVTTANRLRSACPRQQGGHPPADRRGRHGRRQFSCSATHLGEWRARSCPTGRRFERVDEVAIFRLPDGRIAET